LRGTLFETTRRDSCREHAQVEAREKGRACEERFLRRRDATDVNKDQIKTVIQLLKNKII